MEGKGDVAIMLVERRAVSRTAMMARTMDHRHHGAAPRGPDWGAVPTPRPLLTRRESEVLRLLMVRLTDPEIARQLYVSTRTVETHVAHILGKLGAANRREAIALAARNDLL